MNKKNIILLAIIFFYVKIKIMENTTSLFDIIGPVIIGPSSSHTAGACRIGMIARKIYGETTLKKVKFVLYNSFAKTGKGHGTDKGLLGGVLGLKLSDKNIKYAFKIAMEQSIKVEIECRDDFNRHPNSVDVIFDDNKMKISANSTGGGEIEVVKINENSCRLKGDYPTLILNYKDKPGMVSLVTNLICKKNINIANMTCSRSSKGQIAHMSISLDNNLDTSDIKTLERMDEIYFIRYIEALEK